jgi:Holliday junction resolvase RusA-like endonuclease
MSAVRESGAAHIASVAESASSAASASFGRSTKKHQKVPSSTKKRKWSPKVKSSKAKKAKKSPPFVMSVDDPFEVHVSPTRVSFCVRGKPMPQQRDRFGWNGTRYNPSKPSQEAFAKVVHEFFQRHGEVFHFANATIDVKAFFFFPTPNNKASIKNTADVDNLCKFLLDCLNGVLYNDDGQVIRLVAEKSFGDDRGGNGYTIVSISACSE